MESGFKSYGVSYNVSVNTTGASRQLSQLARTVQNYTQGFNSFATAAKDANAAITKLSQATKDNALTFNPRINVEKFKADLQTMTSHVRTAAIEMRTMLYEAMTGQQGGVLSKSIGTAGQAVMKNAAKEAKTIGARTASDVLTGIRQTEAALKQLGHTITKTGKLQKIKGATPISLGTGKGIEQEVQSQSKRLTKLRSEWAAFSKEERAIAEDLEKERAKAIAAQKKSTTKPGAVAAPTASVKPKANAAQNIINQTQSLDAALASWNKLFNGKSGALKLTISLSKGSNAAIRKVNDFVAKLGNIKQSYSPTISPVIDQAAFNDARAKISALQKFSKDKVKSIKGKTPSGMAGAVNTQFLSPTDQKALTEAQNKVAAINNKIATTQGKIDGYKQKFGSALTSQQKGQISKWNNQIAAAKEELKAPQKTISQLTGKAARISSAPKVDITGRLIGITGSEKLRTISITGRLAKIVNPLKEPINIAAKVSATGMRSSVDAIQKRWSTEKNAPRIKVLLETGEALTQLNQLIGEIKKHSPQTIKIQIAGAGAGTGAKGGKSTQRQGVVPPAQISATPAQNKGNGVGTAGVQTQPSWKRQWTKEEEEAFRKLPIQRRSVSLPFRQREFAAFRNAMLPYTTSQSEIDQVFANRRYFKEASRLTNITPSPHMGAGQMHRYLSEVARLMKYDGVAIPTALQSKINSYAAKTAQSTQAEQQARIDKGRAAEAQAAQQKAAAVARQQQRMAALRTSVRNSAIPLSQSEGVLNMVGKHYRSFMEAAAKMGVTASAIKKNPALPAQFVQSLNNPHKKWQFLNHVKDAMTRRGIAVPASIPAQIQAIENESKAAADSRVAEQKANREALQRQRINAVRTSLHNNALPLTQNESMLSMMRKNYRSFLEGAARMGVTSSAIKSNPNLPAQFVQRLKNPTDRLQYLNHVKDVMMGKGAMVPAALQSQINSLQNQIAQTARAAQPPAPVYPTETGTGANQVVWGGARPHATLAPQGYHWERNTNLASRLKATERPGYLKAVDAKDKAFKNLVNAQERMRRLTALQSKAQAALSQSQFQLSWFGKNVAHYEGISSTIDQQIDAIKQKMAPDLKKRNKSASKRIKGYRAQISKLEQEKAEVESKRSLWANARDNEQTKVTHLSNRFSKINAAHTQSLSGARAARDQYKTARGEAARYTNGWSLRSDKDTPLPTRVRAQLKVQSRMAQQLGSSYRSAVAPFEKQFGLSKKEFGALRQHHRFFDEAAKKFGARRGITWNPNQSAAANWAPIQQAMQTMTPTEQLRFLKDTRASMGRAGVTVPKGVESRIKAMEKVNREARVASGRATASAKGAAPTSFYARARAWAYPFTGGTSFGTNTPMAVNMAKGMGMMYAVSGGMSAISNSFGQAMEYQNVMKTTEAILKNGTFSKNSFTPDGFKEMTEIVREVGVKTKFSAPEVASAAKYLAMAGSNIDEINHAIRPIADLALIGDLDLGETADKMTNIMRTFDLDSDQMRAAVNIMTNTANSTNTDLMMLAESAKYGGAIAGLYGKNDPNVFADTMTLFGLMGNAGIQGSSAGTSLRMMYMNLFAPNKKQQKYIDTELAKYGVTVKDKEGNNRSMIDILSDIASEVPEKDFMTVVSKLFRITAQSGAAVLLNQAVQKNPEIVDEVLEGFGKLEAAMDSKEKMSALVQLMKSNREAANRNLSVVISEEKQNTLSGLWAQVTSMFTESIVKAFEHRADGFAGMLKKVRDYFASPQTISMMQHLLDLIVEIGKVMAFFVKIWANLYSLCPDIIRWFVVIEMFFTQAGSLMAPFVKLLGVFSRFKGLFAWFLALPIGGGVMSMAASGGNIIRGAGVAGGAANAQLFKPLKETTATGAPIVLTGRNAAIARTKPAAMAQRVAVQQRYDRMMSRYGWGRVGRTFAGAWKAGKWSNFSAMFIGFGSMLKTSFIGLISKLAGLLGAILSPMGLLTMAVTGAGVWLWKYSQIVRGATEEQLRSREMAEKATEVSIREITKAGQWYRDALDKDKPEVPVAESSIDRELLNNQKEQREEREKKFGVALGDMTTAASKQANESVAAKLAKHVKENPYLAVAFGEKLSDFQYENLINTDQATSVLDTKGYYGHEAMEISWLYKMANINGEAKKQAQFLQHKSMQMLLMEEGFNDPRVQSAIAEMVTKREELDKKYRLLQNKQISRKDYDAAVEVYKTDIQDIGNKALALFPEKGARSTANMTPKELMDIPNLSILDVYREAARNAITANMNGEAYTYIGRMQAMQELRSGQLQKFSEAWDDAMFKVMGDLAITSQYFDKTGSLEKVEQLIHLIPKSGKIDVRKVLGELKEKTKGIFNSIQDVADIAARWYSFLVEKGIMTQDEADKLIRESFRDTMDWSSESGRQSALNYYDQYIATNDNSEWVKKGIGREAYADFIQGKSGNKISTASRSVSVTWERSMLENNVVHAAKKANGLIKGSKISTPSNPNKQEKSESTSTTPTTPSAPSQDRYASSYNSTAEAPKVINFNIHNVASFDRTAIASSAEERDIMAQMEGRIANAVYNIFTMAAQQANSNVMA